MFNNFISQLNAQIINLAPELISRIKTVSLISSAILFLFFIFVLMKLRALQAKQNITDELAPPQAAPAGPYRSRWEEILRHLDSTRESEWKFAVIEADKLVDLVLMRAGFAGETLGDRLMNLKDGALINLEGLWQAHKVRNQLAHNLDYFLRYTEAKRAIDQYEKILNELGVI